MSSPTIIAIILKRIRDFARPVCRHNKQIQNFKVCVASTWYQCQQISKAHCGGGFCGGWCLGFMVSGLYNLLIEIFLKAFALLSGLLSAVTVDLFIAPWVRTRTNVPRKHQYLHTKKNATNFFPATNLVYVKIYCLQMILG